MREETVNIEHTVEMARCNHKIMRPWCQSCIKLKFIKFSSKFPEEGQRTQWLKRCDSKDEAIIVQL